MKPRSKKILAACGALAALVLLALLVAPRFIDANSFRPALERMARERLGRDVTMGELGVSFLPPSVTVRDVAVAGTGGGDPWLSARGVRVRAAWAGLLSGNLQVQGIALDRPTARVLRSPDGRWNLLELLGPREPQAGKRNVSVDSVSVRDGSFEIADAFIRPGEVVRLSFEDVDAKLSGIGSGSGLDVEASGTIAGAGRAAWSGHLGPGNDMDGHATTEALDVSTIAPYVAKRLNLPAIEGVVTSDLDVQRGSSGTLVRGRVDVKRFRLPTAGGVAAADGKADVDLSIDAGGRMDVRRFDLTTGDTKISARGSITDSPGEQVITLEIDGPKVSAADVAALAAAAGTSLPLTGVEAKGMSLAGKARIVRQGEPRSIASVALDGVEMRGLRLGLRRTADGWHLAGARPAPAAREREGSLPLRVRNLHVEDAELRLEDATVSPPSVVEIRDVAARVESWAPGEAGTVDATANVASGKVALHGRVAAPGAAARPWDARLDVSGIDLAQAGALASAAGLQPKAGSADWKATITGTPGVDLAARGRLDLHDARLPLKGGREVTLDLGIDHDVTLLDEGRIRIDRLVLGLPGGPLELQGRVQRGDVLRYDVGTKGPASLTPEAVSWLVALGGRAMPFDLELTEPLTLDAQARNGGAGLELSGRATLAKARLRHEVLPEPLEIARASVEMRGDRVEIEDAALRLGASALDGSLSVEDFEHPQLQFDLHSPQADLDELFSIASRRRTPAAADPAGAPLSQRVRARGRLRVDRASFGGLDMAAMDATVDMREGRLLFDPARLQLYGGEGSGRAAFDLASSPARWDADVALDGVDVQALLLAGLGNGQLSGRGRLQARLQGEAGSLQETLARVRGDGTLHLVDGEIQGLNAMKTLEKASVFGEQSLSALAGRLSREGTPFSSLDAAFTIADGRLNVTESQLVAPDANIDSQGVATFADKGVDVETVIAFSRALSDQMRAEGSRAAQLFWDASRGQVVLPARLSGQLGAMKASIDWKKAGSQILRSGALSSILGGSSPSGASGADGASAPAGNDFGGLLGSILGGGGGDRRPSATTAAPAPRTGESRAEPAQPLPSASGGPTILVEQARMGGSFLTPDLKLRATLQGTDLSHAEVVVTSPEGREVAREERAFEAQVRDFYAAAPRDQPASIPVRLTVDFARLGGAGPFVVTIRPVDARGRAGDEVRADVAKTSPF